MPIPLSIPVNTLSDIQAFYFAHNAPDEMGTTLVLPGSHLRRVSNVSIGRYKNIVGQKRMVSKAGSMFFVHEGIWHCAQPNRTDQTRYVSKLRLRPGQAQRALFNADGYRDADVTLKWKVPSNRRYPPGSDNAPLREPISSFVCFDSPSKRFSAPLSVPTLCTR